MNSIQTQPMEEHLQNFQFCQQGQQDFQFMMLQPQYPWYIPYDMAPMFDFPMTGQPKQDILKKQDSFLLPKTQDFPKMIDESQLQNQLLPKLQKDLEKQPQPPKPAPILKKPKQSHINTGHWTQEEHNTYISFITQYEEEMRSNIKKTSKIFKQMSELIGTRTPSQCRSHHQKFNPFQKKSKGQRSRAGRKKKLKTEEPQEQEQQQGFVPNMYLPSYITMPQAMPADPNHVEYFFQDYKVEEPIGKLEQGQM